MSHSQRSKKVINYPLYFNLRVLVAQKKETEFVKVCPENQRSECKIGYIILLFLGHLIENCFSEPFS